MVRGHTAGERLSSAGELIGAAEGARAHVKVEDALPVLDPEEHDWHVELDLVGLLEREDLEELVERAVPAGRAHQAEARVDHPELAREEVVVFERQLWRHVLVQPRLKRQRDPHPDRAPLRNHRRSLVRRLHQARPAAGRDDDRRDRRVVLILGRRIDHVACVDVLVQDLVHHFVRLLRLPPLRDPARELGRLLHVLAHPFELVVAHEIHFRGGLGLGRFRCFHLLLEQDQLRRVVLSRRAARRAKEKNRTPNPIVTQPALRVLVLAQETDRACVAARQKAL